MRFLKPLIFLIATLDTTAPAFSQEALGVNYNQFLQSIQEQEPSSQSGGCGKTRSSSSTRVFTISPSNTTPSMI
jgi:hypothetical protein